jgi:hypothetical protein
MENKNNLTPKTKYTYIGYSDHHATEHNIEE